LVGTISGFRNKAYQFQFSGGVLDINQMSNAESARIMDVVLEKIPIDPKTGKVT
jgi:hypothetical protein